MAEQASEAAVLFADVSGSTKLYETAGDAVAHAAIEKCVGLMRDKTLQAQGRVIKTIGDEVMSAFPTADAAAEPGAGPASAGDAGQAGGDVIDAEVVDEDKK